MCPEVCDDPLSGVLWETNTLSLRSLRMRRKLLIMNFSSGIARMSHETDGD